MTPRDPNKKGTDLTRLISGALKAKRLALPETEEEIAAAEAELAGKEPPLPAALQNPWAFLDTNIRLRLRTPATPTVNAEVQHELGRAARSGREIPKDVLDRMRQDREAAEAEGDKDEGE